MMSSCCSYDNTFCKQHDVIVHVTWSPVIPTLSIAISFSSGDVGSQRRGTYVFSKFSLFILVWNEIEYWSIGV